MSDLYSVCVAAREGCTVDIRICIVHPDVVDVPLSISFAAMLVEEEAAPGYRAFEAWREARTAENSWFSPRTLYRSVEIVAARQLPRQQSEPPVGMTWDEADQSDDDGILGEVTLRVTTNDPGVLAHLQPGMTWASTAWDEAGEGPTFFGGPDDPRRCERD